MLTSVLSSQELIASIPAINNKLATSTMTRDFCFAFNECTTTSEQSMNTTAEEMSSCTTLQASTSAFRENLKQSNIGSCGLTDEELLMVFGYTAGHFDCMNRYLWSQTGNDAAKNLLVQVLNRALAKLPSYQGFVRRGAVLSPEAWSKHSPGAIVTYQGFTSASTAQGFQSQDRLLIFSKTGKPIMGLSNVNYEREVLFRSQTKFKILNRYIQNGVNYFIMKEVVDGEVSSEASEREILKKAEELKLKGNPQWNGEAWYCPLDNKAVPKSIVQEVAPGFGL